MRQSHRRAHRAVFLGLVLVLPAAFVRIQAARIPEVYVDRLPAVLTAPSYAWEPGPGAFSVRLVDGLLEIRLPEDWNGPDVLVYWTESPGDPEELPADARLVGGLAGAGLARFALPVGVWGAEGAGRVVLYSLARGTVLSIEKPVVGP